ncbi:hypothetical protein [Rhodococcus sp. 3-2]|uniref:hypothetical protein n=1 Tax=Rhodococcus sp. 3-2 TaxID=2890836 RepID=UPI001D1897DB|nr:hypothetical protein [Rhodococcus sp. 3-2]MCC4300436.1 hypothetical protein [Rhodococcus sp. 3-2]
MTTVGEYNASVIMRGVDDGIGLENTVNSFQVTPREGLLELRAGNPGETGPEGPAAYPWKWRGDVADHVALEALRPTLGIAHRGYAYRVVSANSVMYWDGDSFYPFLNAFGAAGPQGPATSLAIGTVTTLPQGSSATATITGTPPNQVLNLGIPRGGAGAKGDIGAAGPLRNAADYDNSSAPTQDSVPAWDVASSKWRPVQYPAWRGPWALAASSFPAISATPALTSTVVSMTIPAQPLPWRPNVQAGLTLRVHDGAGGTNATVEVRMGSPTGQIVAMGMGLNQDVWSRVSVMPYFGEQAMTPTTERAIVGAGDTVNLFMVVNRISGTAVLSWMNQFAELTVWAQPVYAP